VPRLEDLPPPEGGTSEGYYPDPLGGKYPRWWDGSQWTARVGQAPKPEIKPGEDRDVRKVPREPGALIGATFRLYRRFPLLFVVLAAGVIIPTDLIILAITGGGAFSQADTPLSTQVATGVVGWVLVGPLISALHVHAVADVREGKDPHVGAVARRGLTVLPVVAAATIMSGLGIALGLVALIVPGVILFFRWAVVAQVAAIDHQGWIEALRGSRALTAGNYIQIFLVILLIAVTVGWTGSIAGIVLKHDHSAAAFVIDTAIHIVTASFSALATALLYFDLVARKETAQT
jgi:hypothetical protein